MKKISLSLVDRARRKLLNSTPSRTYVAAICYDNRARLLGITYNYPRIGKKGGGMHSEMNALQKWGTRVHSITLIRFGQGGAIRPIHPCKNCQKVLDKLKIKVSLIA